MTDDDRLGGRLRRFADVGLAASGIAARFAVRYVGGQGRTGAGQEPLAADLRAALGRLRGPLMKAAQLASTVPDAMPEEFVRHLGELQSNAPPMGWPFVRRRMEAELDPGWMALFRRFERNARAAASLGQVHQAEGLDGRLLACKLQYPDMGSAVEADLRQLKIVFALYRRYDPAIDPGGIFQEIAARLREELDYRREARHIGLYRHMLDGWEGIRIPETVPALSTGRLLTMGWLAGERLTDCRDAPEPLRNHMAENLFSAWYAPLYRYGVLHGDPHLGNYTATRRGEINLLDFGCVRIFSGSFVSSIISLYEAIRDGDEEKSIFAYESWGFSGLDREMIGVLDLWARFVYAPVLVDRVQAMAETNDTTAGARLAAQVARELRRLGGVRPPAEFLLMDRAAIGLGSAFLRLGARLNWHRMFEALIDGFDPAALERRQADAKAAAGLGLGASG